MLFSAAAVCILLFSMSEEIVDHISPAEKPVDDCPSDGMPVDVADYHCQCTSECDTGFGGFAYLMLFAFFFHYQSPRFLLILFSDPRFCFRLLSLSKRSRVQDLRIRVT